MLVSLAVYTARDGAARAVEILIFGSPPTVSRPTAALLAARLSRHAGLVLDRSRDGGGDVRVLAELAAGEGLAAARALIADYLPRARRAAKPLGRPLVPEDLLGANEQTGAAPERREPLWAA